MNTPSHKVTVHLVLKDVDVSSYMTDGTTMTNVTVAMFKTILTDAVIKHINSTNWNEIRDSIRDYKGQK